jgi:hypothetical protein
MKEVAEFRVDERFASMLFAENEGKRVGSSVRMIELDTTDPRFAEVGRLQRELRAKQGEPFFYGWRLKRKPSMQELRATRVFSLQVTAFFEPAGEERGTKYDNSSACPNCGAGAKQIGPLILDVKRIPKGKDIAMTIAGEIVVSQRVGALFERHGVSGVALGPVRMNAASSAESKDWFQLNVQSANAEIVAPTRVGIDPFDDDSLGECRCPLGDLLGLNLLSEVTIRATTRGDADFVSSRQYIGVRRGLLRPERVILISPKVWELIDSEKLKGVEAEIAHLA